MSTLKSATIQCPHCWEFIEILIDCSSEQQEYIEDCQVCCNPINIMVSATEDEILYLEARSDSE